MRAERYRSQLEGSVVVISFMTVAELHRIPLVTHTLRPYVGITGLQVISEQ